MAEVRPEEISAILRRQLSGYENEIEQGLGIERLQQYAQALGYNAQSGIELKGEQDGLIPDPKWKRINTGEKIDAVGNAVTDKEVGYGRHAKIGQNLDQCIDLIFLAHGADFKESETCVHGQHHNGAKQDEKHITAGLKCTHETPKRLTREILASTIPAHKYPC